MVAGRRIFLFAGKIFYEQRWFGKRDKVFFFGPYNLIRLKMVLYGEKLSMYDGFKILSRQSCFYETLTNRKQK